MTDEKAINDQEYESLKETIKKILGFRSKDYTESFLLRRIGVRMRHRKTEKFSEYEEMFKSEKKEQEDLLKNLTIHVTEFFRDPVFWKFCKEIFFQKAIKTFSERKIINIWSAGCSSGQEAISILITFLEIDPDLKDRIRIVCTDISSMIIEKAKTLEYDTHIETKGLTDELIDKYFVRKSTFLESEKIVLKEEYRKNFVFIRHDILSDKLIENMDIIFLRNTVIYFSKESKEKLYVRIYESLNNKGFFILGKTETLTGHAKEKFIIYDSHERIFEKSRSLVMSHHN